MSNLHFLTNSHKIIASKKRAKKEQIKEIVFDESARKDFLTGFHKRKLAKKEEAKKKVQEREKQERLEARREKRQLLAEQAAQNAAEVEKACGAVINEDDGDDMAGLSRDSKGKQRAMEQEDEYEDEEVLATVTVVEDFDPEALLHGDTVPHTESHPDNSPEPSLHQSKPRRTESTPIAQKRSQTKIVAKAKKIKYETKAARNAERSKQQRRKVEKAERAGGKHSRSKGKSRGRR
ncbi:RRP17 family protein [Abortiporus biennis]